MWLETVRSSYTTFFHDLIIDQREIFDDIKFEMVTWISLLTSDVVMIVCTSLLTADAACPPLNVVCDM